MDSLGRGRGEHELAEKGLHGIEGKHIGKLHRNSVWFMSNRINWFRDMKQVQYISKTNHSSKISVQDLHTPR